MQIAASIPRPVRRFVPVGGFGARSILLVVIVLGVLGGLGVVAYQRFFTSVPQAPVGQVVPVQRGNVAATVSATGSVVATHQAKLVFANAGRIQDIQVSVGDHVTAGQPLAAIKAADQTCSKFGGSSGECATARAGNYARQASILKAQQQVTLLSGGGSWQQLQAHKDVLTAQADYDAAAASFKQTELAHNLNVELIGAQTAYDTSLSALTSARAKLDQVRAGPTTVDQVTAQSAVDQARSAPTPARSSWPMATTGTRA